MAIHHLTVATRAFVVTDPISLMSLRAIAVLQQYRQNQPR
jgi:hypothetical protein